MKRSEILAEANKITNGARQEHYGSPEDNFANIAMLWQCHTGKSVTPVDVAIMMILLKVARLKADPLHMDSWVDICGYAACGGEMVSERTRVEES